MLRVIKVQLLEAFSPGELEGETNNYSKYNKNQIIIDVKYDVYETDISPEFIEEDGKTTEKRHSALLLIGEEV
ncbi:hypothetical protein [Sporosarcina sp. E16_8]|uniref:hypothetical protein n=1 Tax=Sporosarcina sp. E16_8 TaxID=2789295 RepID=UPI001A91CEB1|nr:hypothetical protein [Sporosarcina sp. E16_8]MBO0587988.1 hypothetical protein [Sporosarcina sp. E16_8]